jgi:hypothetical protein
MHGELLWHCVHVIVHRFYHKTTELSGPSLQLRSSITLYDWLVYGYIHNIIYYILAYVHCMFPSNNILKAGFHLGFLSGGGGAKRHKSGRGYFKCFFISKVFVNLGV